MKEEVKEMAKEVDPQVESSKALKERFLQLLVSSVSSVRVVMTEQRGSLSVQYYSMLILRLLFRKEFLSQNAINLSMCVNIESIDDKSSGSYSNNMDDSISLSDAQSLHSSGVDSSAPTAASGHPKHPPDQRSQNHIEAKLNNQLLHAIRQQQQQQQQEVVSAQDTKPQHYDFAELLYGISQAHTNCYEVVEQLLLLVIHISQLSLVCKLALLDADIGQALRQIRSSQAAKPYLCALCDIGLEALST